MLNIDSPLSCLINSAGYTNLEKEVQYISTGYLNDDFSTIFQYSYEHLRCVRCGEAVLPNNRSRWQWLSHPSRRCVYKMGIHLETDPLKISGVGVIRSSADVWNSWHVRHTNIVMNWVYIVNGWNQVTSHWNMPLLIHWNKSIKIVPCVRNYHCVQIIYISILT